MTQRLCVSDDVSGDDDAVDDDAELAADKSAEDSNKAAKALAAAQVSGDTSWGLAVRDYRAVVPSG